MKTCIFNCYHIDKLHTIGILNSECQQEGNDYRSSSHCLSLRNILSFCKNLITVSVETYGTNFGSN